MFMKNHEMAFCSLENFRWLMSTLEIIFLAFLNVSPQTHKFWLIYDNNRCYMRSTCSCIKNKLLVHRNLACNELILNPWITEKLLLLNFKKSFKVCMFQSQISHKFSFFFSLIPLNLWYVCVHKFVDCPTDVSVFGKILFLLRSI